jgi:Fic family protein
MIVSMRPPYEITATILQSISTISEKIGGVKANFLNKPSPELGKQNRIRTIHSSLGIEGNTLTREQITDIIENKRIAGPKKDILEVQNAIWVYDRLKEWDPFQAKSFLSAHRELMKGLIDEPGKFRTGGVGIVHGRQIAHLAPPPNNVPTLMNELFGYLRRGNELSLIKSCVFHYEVEFIHPFLDGNGRMGRLWQTLILMKDHPVFEYLPLETLIHESREEYYKALSQSDKSGESTQFIEYMLDIIDRSLGELLSFSNRNMTEKERIDYFISMGTKEFSRKDYMDVFRDISTATASRDLKKGVEMGVFQKTGSKNKTRYNI